MEVCFSCREEGCSCPAGEEGRGGEWKGRGGEGRGGKRGESKFT